MIRKVLPLVLALLLVFAVSACEQKEVIPPSLSTPEEACESLSRALKAYDLSAAKECLLYPEDIKALDLSGEQLLTPFAPFFAEWAGKLEYTVRSASASDGNARVTVDYRYADASSVLKDAAKAYLAAVKDMAAEGKEDSEITTALPGILEDCAKKASLSESSLSVEYELVQGGGEWKIVSVPEELIKIMTSDLFLSAEEVASDLKPYLPAD